MDRRTLIKGLAAFAPLAGIRHLAAQDGEAPAGECSLIEQDIRGPYDVDGIPLRSDIVEGQAGTPLRLDFRVVDSGSCAPLEGALVSIWHANAAGLYSGVENIMLDGGDGPTGERIDTRGSTFLRGIQRTDRDGRATFRTIFPGWYYPRPTHLHLVVTPPNYGETSTTQLYFPDAVCDEAYRAGPYAARGPNPARHDPNRPSPTDSSDVAELWLDLDRQGDGWVAGREIGVTWYGDAFGELPAFYRQS